MPQGGFVDLRLNQVDSDEQSFWPTFTDIMTVIVLIFLLAMLTLLVKNMDLVEQLRDSLASERTATAQAQSTTSRNTALNLRLRSLQEESAMLRMRLMDLGEEHGRTLSQLSSAEHVNSKLKSDLSAITQARNVILDEKAELQQNKADLMAQLAQRVEALAEQQRQYHLNLEAMGLLQTDNKAQLDRLKRLESEYANLETKYKRLIRPARSHLGKAVVFVRYHKQDGKLSIEIKAPGDGQYMPVNGVTLHKRLSALQQKHGKKLYVRIVFPDDSGLSYTEAWNLTESLLRMYDYYYQQ